MNGVLIFSGILAFFALIGFLFGLIRGVRKSVYRLTVVLISAVLAFVLAVNLASAVMNTSISELPEDTQAQLMAMVGESGLPITEDSTLNDVMVGAMTADETMSQLVEAAPTLTNFILGAPQALIAEIFFLVLFFLLKFVLWFPTAIIGAIFIRKKSQRLLGGVVGALQGVICACVVLVPIFGFMMTLDTAIAAIPASSEPPAEGSVVATITDLDEQFYSPLKSDPGYAVLKAVGVEKLCNDVFYGLSTVTAKDGSTTCFFRDLNETIPALMPLVQLEQLNMDALDASDIALIRSLVTTFTDTPLIINTLSEVVSSMARTLLAGDSFLGIAPPAADQDPNSAVLMNDILTTLADVDVDTLKTNLPQIIDLFGVLVEYDALNAMSESEDGIVALLANEDFTADFLSAMTKSEILSPIAVSAVNNVGINMIAEALGIPEDDAAVRELMLDDLLAELSKIREPGGEGVTPLADDPATRDEAVAALADILLHYAEGLAENDATDLAGDLFDAFSMIDAESANKHTIDAIVSVNALLSAQGFKSAIVIRSDLVAAEIDTFVEMTPAEREAEVANLARIIHSAADMMNNLGGGFSDLASQLDILPAIGKMLNAMEDSVLLCNSAEGMLLHFLEMDEIKAVIAEKALQTLHTKISEGAVDYEATFTSIAAAYRMAEALNRPDGGTPDQPGASAGQLAEAIEDLFTSMDETTAEIIKDAVDDKFLSDMGIPEESAGTAEAILSTFFDEVAKNADNEDIDYEQEGKAVETIMGLVTNSGSEEVQIEDIINDETLETIVESAAISGTLITISQDEEIDLNLGEQLSEEDRSTISNAIDDFAAQNPDDEKTAACLDALRAMLGISVAE